MNIFGRPASAGDNLAFLRLRWLLVACLAVQMGVHWREDAFERGGAMAVLAVLLASQAGLWKLPAAWLKGMRIYTTIFLLDLGLVLVSLVLQGQLSMPLTACLFVSLFLAAVAQRLSLALACGALASALYVGWTGYSPEGFDLGSTQDLLVLPFLFIVGLHAAVLVSEAQFQAEIMEVLSQDNLALSKKLGATGRELKQRKLLLPSLLDGLPVPALVLDSDGRIQVFNNRAEALFEVRRGALIEKVSSEVAFLDPLRRALERGFSDAGVEAQFQTVKGKPVNCLVRSGAARDEEGKLLSIAVAFSPYAPAPGNS